MAYVAGQSPEDQEAAANVGTNIFQQTMGQPGQGGQAAQGSAPQADESQAISSGGGATGQKAAAPSNAASSSKEVIRRNQDKAKSPYDLSQMGQDISKARTDLQAESNQYVTDQGKNTYGVQDDAIKKGLYGDDDAFNQTAQRLTQAQPLYQEWAPTTNTDYTSTTNKLSDTGLRDYFKSNSGPMGTAGEAALDTLLLGKNKDFKQQRESVKNEAATLGTQAKQSKTDTDTAAKAAYDTGYAGETDREKGVIKDETGKVLSSAQQQADAENAKRVQMLAAVQGSGNAALIPYIEQQTGKPYQQWIQEVIGQVAKSPAEAEYLSRNMEINLRNSGNNTGGSGDLSQGFGFSPEYGPKMNANDLTFANLATGQASANNYLDSSQAEALNRGNALLGAGGDSYAPQALDSAIKLNPDAALAYLNKTVGGYRDTIAANQKDTAAHQAQAEADAKLFNEIKMKAQGTAAQREEVRELARTDKIPANMKAWFQSTFPDIFGSNSVLGQGLDPGGLTSAGSKGAGGMWENVKKGKLPGIG